MVQKSFFYALLLHLCLELYANDELLPEHYLEQGDELLIDGLEQNAIEAYQNGIWRLSGEDSLMVEVSLYTNLATALSSIGDDSQAVDSYQFALKSYAKKIGDVTDPSVKSEIESITAQSSFFLGMVYQDLDSPEDAVEAYTLAHTLDPYHWASLANLGSVYQDALSNYASALQAYNKAYALLTDRSTPTTDPPPEPRPILSQLQYRIGLCITHDTRQKCALLEDPDSSVDCDELAKHAFSLAVEFDPENELAKHMLATLTADASLKRASNTYVKSLFDDYAKNFEHSLVQELGYNGYERLRLGFDRAFQGTPPNFRLVVDAGCGTGLVGEQFRNLSSYLVGVDLSQTIIDQAVKKRPNLYDETVADDVTNVFRRMKPISLIIAADSYIYFGDLDPLFDAMEEGLESGGYVAFTLENVDAGTEAVLSQTKGDWRWQLTPSGRFAHRKEYVLEVAKMHHLQLNHYEALDGFRHERGVPVRGHMFVLRKTPTDNEF